MIASVIASGPDFERWSDAILADLPPLDEADARAVGRITAAIDARRRAGDRSATEPNEPAMAST